MLITSISTETYALMAYATRLDARDAADVWAAASPTEVKRIVACFKGRMGSFKQPDGQDEWIEVFQIEHASLVAQYSRKVRRVLQDTAIDTFPI